MGHLQVPATGEVPLLSADLGIERALPGGKVIPGKRTLYFGYMAIYRGRGDLEMLARLVTFVRGLATERSNEFVRVRAGAVEIAGRGVLLPAPDDLRMTALIAILVRDGAEQVADDLTRIDPVMHRLHPLPLPLLVDADHLELFPELARVPQRRRTRGLTELLRRAMHRQPISVDELQGEMASEPVPIDWIVFPKFEPGAQTRLEPFGGAAALFTFAETRLNLHIWGDRALALMRDLLNEAAVSRLTVGSIPDAARLLLEAAPRTVGEVTG